jgi:hypothetical protein
MPSERIEIMEYIRGYRSLALLQMLMCIGFFFNINSQTYGLVFNIYNFFGAGILFLGSIFAYFKPQRYLLWTMIITMMCLIIFNVIWFIYYGVFLETGFPLIAYDILFIIGNFHFLGKGL